MYEKVKNQNKTKNVLYILDLESIEKISHQKCFIVICEGPHTERKVQITALQRYNVTVLLITG